MMLFKVNVYAFAASYLLFVNGQTNHIVNVALEGSFFSPPITGAQANDTVVFQFLGDIHTVTQSSFENPCSPLPGGFNSGAAGKGTNSSAPVKTWTLTISNVSAPIWFFCEITRPMSHCNQGMVGAINPPSPDMFNQFQIAAKLATGTPAPNATVALTGQGAFATNLPTAPPIPVSVPSSAPTTTSSLSTPTSTSTSISSSISPTQTVAVSSTKSHLGAIVGGSVAGGIALIGLISILWLLCRRKKKVPQIHEADDFFRYNPVPVRRPSEVFAEAKRTENITHNNSVTSHAITNYSADNGSRATHLSPVRPQFGQSGPRILEPPHLHRQPSAQSDLLSSDLAPSTSGHTHSEQANNKIDIRTLAQEVAAVLYQGPPGHQKDSSSQDLRGQMTVQNMDHEDSHSAILRQAQPPPNYHMATGPSPAHRGHVRKT